MGRMPGVLRFPFMSNWKRCIINIKERGYGYESGGCIWVRAAAGL